MIDEFKPGMHVKVREFEDMKNDPGFRVFDGDIASPNGVIFLHDDMGDFCGVEFCVDSNEIWLGDYILRDKEGYGYRIDRFMVDLVDRGQVMEFKVGDVVRIRDWDDMAKEYHVDRDGDIMHNLRWFYHSQRKLCGREAIVDETIGVRGFNLVRLTMLDDGKSDEIFDWAVEPVNNTNFSLEDVCDFFGLVGDAK